MMTSVLRGQVWKWVSIMTFSGLKWGQSLEKGAAHPHQEFPGILPPPRVDNVANFENVFRLWSARFPLSQFHLQKQITRDAAVIMTIRESKTKTALWTSQFTCRPIVVSFIRVAISPLIFSCGKVDVGTSQPKKSHSGFHPCFTLYTSSFSDGTMDFTRWLCIRYRFLKTQVDFGFIKPSDACEQVYYESCLACQHFFLQLLIGRVPRE